MARTVCVRQRNASMASFLQNSSCRSKMTEVVLGCGLHRHDVSGCPRVQTSIGRRGFAVHGHTVWNGLPSALRHNSLSLNTFEQQLKTYLFGQQ